MFEMPTCSGAVGRDGIPVCKLHDVALVDREVAELRGFTGPAPTFGAQWFCPVSGEPVGEIAADKSYLLDIG